MSETQTQPEDGDNADSGAGALLRRRWVLAAGALLVAAGTVAILVGAPKYSEHRNRQALLGAAKDASFPLYYPAKRPAGYAFDAGSVTYAQGVLFYKLRKGESIISVSEQNRPATLSAKRGIDGFEQFLLPIGTGLIGKGSFPAVIVLTDDSLINIGASGAVKSEVLRQAAEGLQQIN